MFLDSNQGEDKILDQKKTGISRFQSAFMFFSFEICVLLGYYAACIGDSSSSLLSIPLVGETNCYTNTKIR